MVSRRGIFEHTVRRVSPGLIGVLALILATFGPPTPVSVAQVKPPVVPGSGELAPPPPPTPAAYLQVAIHQTYIEDDRDLIGGGEELLTVRFYRCAAPSPDGCLATDTPSPTILAEWQKSMDADTGDRVSLERMFPLGEDIKDPNGASESDGFPVYAGTDYMLEFLMVERDPAGGQDLMGVVERPVTAAHNWGIGSYSDDQARPNPYQLCAPASACDNGANFQMTYDIVQTPFPDLHPTAINIYGKAGPGVEVCVPVTNQGQREAGSFQVSVALDGTQLPTGYADSGGLGAGESTAPCAKVDLPASGVHKLLATVDNTQAVHESDETNNQLEQTFLFGRFGDTGVLGPGIGEVSVNPGENPPPLPDLSLTGIRVQGSNPSGPNDCDPGKNTIFVMVSNPGGVVSFVVRVIVDNQTDSPHDVTIGGNAGGARLVEIFEIPFNNASLAQGDHTIAATVDPDNVVSESNEDNNSLSVIASCQDE